MKTAILAVAMSLCLLFHGWRADAAACDATIKTTDGKTFTLATKITGATAPLKVGNCASATIETDGKIHFGVGCLDKVLPADGNSIVVSPPQGATGGCDDNGKQVLKVSLDAAGLSSGASQKLGVFTENGTWHACGENSAPDMTFLLPKRGGGWLLRTVTFSSNSVPALPTELGNAVSMGGGTGTFLAIVGGALQSLKLERTASCNTAAQKPTASADCNGAPLKSKHWCRADGFEGHEMICVDMTCGGRKVVKAPARSVVAPNTGLVVHVLHDSTSSVKVTWGGKRGLTPPEVSKPAVGHTDEKVPTGQSTMTFAPRQPGSADVTVTVENKSKNESFVLTIELEVDRLMWGAIRFGFGTVFGDAATRVYETRTVAGSNQPEIAVKDDPRVNFEVVVAIAPYLFDVIAWGGRSHATRSRNARAAPYVGFGLVGQSGTGVDALQSLYAGLEAEFATSFSLAGCAVWRRVTDLSAGYHVGSPVDVGTTYTTTKTGFGFGLVLNVSPDFLQFGSANGSAEPSNNESSTERKGS